MQLAPHPFTLRQLQYITAVAEELSFRRAAARCRVSQPSLSAQITQVEEAIGIQLFERSSKRVLVTAAGRELVKRAVLLLRDADELVAAAQRTIDPFSGSIRLGILPTISPYLLPEVTPGLRRAFPRLRIVWLEDTTDSLMKKLNEGVLDGAVLALEASIGVVEKVVLAVDPFVLIARPEHPLASASSPVSTAALRDEELLLLDEGHCFREQALEVCTSARARESDFRATSLSTLVQMVAGGGGITLLPSIAIAAEARRAGLHVRAVASASARRTLALVWRKGSVNERALRAVANTVREAYPRHEAIAGEQAPRRARAKTTRARSS